MNWELAGLIVALLLSAFFSGSETAYTASSRLSLEVFRRHGRRGSRPAYRLITNPTLLFSTTLVGNNLVGVLYSSLAALYLKHIGVPLGWIMVISPAVVLLFGEVLPKTIARERPEPWAMRAAGGLRGAHLLLLPLILAARAASGVVLALLGARRDPERPAVTLGDLRGLWGDLRRSGRLDSDEVRLLDQAITLRSIKVREVMTARPEVVALPLEAPVEEAVRIVSARGLTRIPVFEGSMDSIVGVVHAMDLLEGPESIRQALRPIHPVPEQAPVAKLLPVFQRGGPGIALVVDEHGGTAGVVTLEDLLEEMVGEIDDEHDPRALTGRRLSSGTYVVPGRAALERLDEELDITLPRGDYDTVAGLILNRLARIPEVGESVEAGNWTLRVVAGDRRRIKRVLVRWRGRRTDAPAPDPGGQ